MANIRRISHTISPIRVIGFSGYGRTLLVPFRVRVPRPSSCSSFRTSLLRRSSIVAGRMSSCMRVSVRTSSSVVSCRSSFHRIAASSSPLSITSSYLRVLVSSYPSSVSSVVSRLVLSLFGLRNFARRHGSDHYIWRAASKVPMLKPGEYELWRMRMEQYIQMVDYSLWEVIENGNAPSITKLVEGVETVIAPSIAEEKAQEEEGLEGIAAIKKELRGFLITAEYENFTSSSLEVLDQTFDRLQKLTSQLEIHGESISQEDVNQKFLRSLSPEWNTHTIVWRNKTEIDTLSLDDLYNNLKIYEAEEVSITELREVGNGSKNKDEIQLTLENFENSSKNLNKLLDCQIVVKCKRCLGYNAIPPLYTGNFLPPKHDLSFFGIEEFVNEPIVSDSKEEDVPQAKKEKKTVKSSFAKIKFVKSKEQVKTPRKTIVIQKVNAVKASVIGFGTKGNKVIDCNPQMDLQDQGVIDSGCSRHMTGNMSYFTNFKEIDEGYVALEENPKGGKITGRGTIKTGNLGFKNVYFVKESVS
ncbi:hypothetical protein Tco_0485481 [Tanacetum coccineum]